MIEQLERVIGALNEAGLPARRGFPAEKMPHLTAPVARVSIRQITEDVTSLDVQIYAPLSLGGSACEDGAVGAARALAALGGQWQIGSCVFEGKSGTFQLPMQVSFARETPRLVQPQVELNGEVVDNVLDVSTGFRAAMMADGESTGLIAGEKRWTVTVEDLTDGAENALTDGFTVDILRDGQRVRYSGCCWTKITTTAAAGGIRRVRVAATGVPPVITAE